MTFNNSFEANLAASHLEHEGIETFIQDQNISNIYPNATGAVNLVVGSPFGAYGGVKLQIKDDDVQKAIEVLKSNGYLNEVDEKPSELTESLDKITGKLPFLHQYPLQVKLLAIAFFTLAVILTIFFFANNH